MATARPDANCR